MKKIIVYCLLLVGCLLLILPIDVTAEESYYTLSPGNYESSTFESPFIVGQKGQIRRSSDSPLKDSIYSFDIKVDDPTILSFDEKGNWQALKEGTTNVHFFISTSQKFYDEIQQLGIKNLVTTEELYTETITVLTKTLDVYRLYNLSSGEHFYTTNLVEKSHLIQLGWQDEGIAWKADRDGIPIQRWYNPNTGDHHYSLNFREGENLLQVGWINEGIAFYTHGQSGVMRLYNPNTKVGTHFFTTSNIEKNSLLQLGWQDEGTAFPFIDEE